ncbi:ABC transporter permease subunit [Rhodobacteraceae bacterium 2CG4]|uniref:ABC transporter permease subunit n=1 Tax=Halovulum marinum TaxID=2662447 RepID=A0A6L5YYJ1_9RHOB|nr:carbohydrate ABC transporter permease [Halovulum marinum]MSU89347.1 ABC transporter permease subunit [Halovulum marinum]
MATSKTTDAVAAPVFERSYDTEALAANRRRRRNKARAKKLGLHLILLGLLFVMLYPVIWMVFSSLRPENEIFADLGLIPDTWTLQNYITGWNLFGDKTFGVFFVNSFIICALAIIGNLVACSMAAYAFARLNFRFKWFWFALMLGTIMLPIHAQLIPQYVFFLKIGWVNTILPLVVPKFLATDAFFIFLMVQFMRSLPRELEEAATIDGATYWQRYWRIILPLTMPALATTAVFTFINTYNDFFGQLIYLTEIDKMTVPVALRLFLDPSGGTSSYGGMFAMVLVSIGPVLGFFLASQRLLVRGIATTGFK